MPQPQTIFFSNGDQHAGDDEQKNDDPFECDHCGRGWVIQPEGYRQRIIVTVNGEAIVKLPKPSRAPPKSDPDSEERVDVCRECGERLNGAIPTLSFQVIGGETTTPFACPSGPSVVKPRNERFRRRVLRNFSQIAPLL